jgi:nicotinate-nucleotide pyrophosphorylase (carboxylating)
MGLADGCLIKDNHLAAWCFANTVHSIAAAIAAARCAVPAALPVEIEVDTVEQLVDALVGKPDIVLLDNMDVAMLRESVSLRDRIAPGVLLEASGGIRLANAAEIAAMGVDRISVGAMTHSAPALDLAFDWP